MTDLPVPLTPPDCDLRGMPYMPLDIIRLFDSDLYALSTGDEFKAALTLWGKSFLQVPAGSLPEDDRILAHLSGAGLGWKKVRTMALRGWIKCSDGRLHHPVVAEKAADAWKARKLRHSRTEAARAAKQQRADAVSDNGGDDAATSDVTASVAEVVTEPIRHVTIPVTDDVTGSKGTEEKGREEKKEKKLTSFLAPRASTEADETATGIATGPPIQPPDGELRRPLASSPAAVVGQVAASLSGRRKGSDRGGPRRPVRTPAEQIEALNGHPRAVPKPLEPVRTVEEQLAILRGAAA